MYDTSWYDTLVKPFLTPPPEIFTPVWIVLYITILIALIIFILKKTHKNKITGFVYFLIQLILNIIWAPVFFHTENIALALVIIILLDIFVFLTLKEFNKITPIAAKILIPYFFWIIFATYLNFGILILN